MSTQKLFDRVDVGSPTWWQDVYAIGTPLRGSLSSVQSKSQSKAQSDSQPNSLFSSLLNSTIELTFLWRGTDAAQVFIDVYSHTPHITQSLTALTRIEHTDVWYWCTRLPMDWCGSYFLMPVAAQDLPRPENRRARRTWWIDLMERCAQADGFNRMPPHNSGWGLPLSAIQLQPSALPVATTKSVHNLHRQRWSSQQLGNERSVWLYKTGCTDKHAEDIPLVILLDGHYWANCQPLLAQLDVLTDSGMLAQAHYLFIDALSPEARSDELPCNTQFWQALQDELLPQLQTDLALTDLTLTGSPVSHSLLTKDPAKTLIVGQSFGGLAAAFAVLHWPERFGMALSQSGSFWWPNADENGDQGELTQAVLTQSGLTQSVVAGQGWSSYVRIHLDIGCYEEDMLAVNRVFRDALQRAGHAVTYHEFRGGHDWLCWREGLLQGLVTLLGTSNTVDAAASGAFQKQFSL